jgi:hypothetical protein
MRGRWRNFENIRSEKSIKGNACNPKRGSITITLVMITLIAFINYGCMNWVVHRKATPTKETRIASGPNTTKIRELTVSAQPTVSNPHVPVMLLYSERVTGPEEMVVAYEQREYKSEWGNFFHIPATLMVLAVLPIALPLTKVFKGQWYYSTEEQTEWGCPDLFPSLLYGLIGHMPCGSATGKSFPISNNYRKLPVVEEIHQTDRTGEQRHPLPRQLVQVTVVAQGAQWQTNTVLTVLTDAEGQESIPLDSVFKESPNAPQEVTVILTGDEVQTTVHLDSHTCEAIYTRVRK